MSIYEEIKGRPMATGLRYRCRDCQMTYIFEIGDDETVRRVFFRAVNPKFDRMTDFSEFMRRTHEHNDGSVGVGDLIGMAVEGEKR